MVVHASGRTAPFIGLHRTPAAYVDIRLSGLGMVQNDPGQLAASVGIGRVATVRSHTGRFVINGTLEIQAEEFAPLREPLADLLGTKYFSISKKSPIKVTVRLNRNAPHGP